MLPVIVSLGSKAESILSLWDCDDVTAEKNIN